jgi:hypothetical protein
VWPGDFKGENAVLRRRIKPASANHEEDENTGTKPLNVSPRALDPEPLRDIKTYRFISGLDLALIGPPLGGFGKANKAVQAAPGSALFFFLRAGLPACLEATGECRM